MRMSKLLDDKLGLPPAIIEPPPVKEIVPSEPGKNENDEAFDIARENILSVLEQANEASKEIHRIAQEKEDARHFEAFNSILKTVLQASTDLLNIHKAKKELKAGHVPQMGGDMTQITNIENAVFTGTANELQDLIAQMTGKKTEDE